MDRALFLQRRASDVLGFALDARLDIVAQTLAQRRREGG
jgi:hypothetical protein